MSGLKNVLGNVYGDPDDRPQEATLDDVQESMDALTEHVDDDVAADEDYSLVDSADADGPDPDVDSDGAVSEFGEWLDDSEPFGPAADLDEDTAKPGALESPPADGEDDSPWAMLDELPDLHETHSLADDGDATEAVPEGTASEDPDAGASWLSVVENEPNAEDWLNDYDDDSGWTGSKQDQAAPIDNNDVDNNDVDELENFDFAAVEHPSDGANEEDLLQTSVGGSGLAPADEPTANPDPEESVEAEADGVDDDLDPGQEAWLDDLFSVQVETENDTDSVDRHSQEVTDGSVNPQVGQPNHTTDTIDDSVRASEGRATTASTGLDAISAVYSATDQLNTPDSKPTTAIEPPAGAFYGGWARIDDDILPQKKSGGRRGHKKGEIAIAPHSQQLLQAQNHVDDVHSVDVEHQESLVEQPNHLEADLDIALFEGLDHDGASAGESSEAAPQQSEADDLETPSFDQPLLHSDEELDASDAVHLFAHDEALEEAATAGGRRKARKEAAKQAKAEKSAEAKAKKETAKKAKAAKHAEKSLDPSNAEDPVGPSVEPASDISPKAKAAAAKAARTERAIAKKEARKQSKAEKAMAKKLPNDRKSRGRKTRNDNSDEALRAQVDAALAAQVATNTDASSDDFWTDAAAVQAAKVTPSAPVGMADPLDTELITPPPTPSEGFDPGPVLD